MPPKDDNKTNTGKDTAAPAAGAAAAAAAADTKKARVNALKFNVAGHIVVSTKITKTMVAAADLYNAALSVLRCEGKPEEIIKEVTDALKKAQELKIGAKLTKDAEPDLAQVNAETGEE